MREQMKLKISKCNDDDEKQRLLKNLENFEESLNQQMRAEVEG